MIVKDATPGPWFCEKRTFSHGSGYKTTYTFLSHNKPNKSYPKSPGIVFSVEYIHSDLNFEPIKQADIDFICAASEMLK